MTSPFDHLNAFDYSLPVEQWPDIRLVGPVVYVADDPFEGGYFVCGLKTYVFRKESPWDIELSGEIAQQDDEAIHLCIGIIRVILEVAVLAAFNMAISIKLINSAKFIYFARRTVGEFEP